LLPNRLAEIDLRGRRDCARGSARNRAGSGAKRGCAEDRADDGTTRGTDSRTTDSPVTRAASAGREQESERHNRRTDGGIFQGLHRVSPHRNNSSYHDSGETRFIPVTYRLSYCHEIAIIF